MRSDGVVVAAPTVDDDLGFVERLEEFANCTSMSRTFVYPA